MNQENAAFPTLEFSIGVHHHESFKTLSRAPNWQPEALRDISEQSTRRLHSTAASSLTIEVHHTVPRALPSGYLSAPRTQSLKRFA